MVRSWLCRRAVLKALIEINVPAEFLEGLNNVGHWWVCKMIKIRKEGKLPATEHQMYFCGNLEAMSDCARRSPGRDLAGTAERRAAVFLKYQSWDAAADMSVA